MEEKITVYICSLKGISTLAFVDKDSMGHPCVTSRYGEDVFSGFRHMPAGSWDGCLTKEQMKILDVVDEFCRENALEYEVVDVAGLGFSKKMRLVLNRIKAPAVSFKGKTIEGIPTKDDLKALTSR